MLARASSIVLHPSHTRTGLLELGNIIFWSEQSLQNISPQFRQWCYKIHNTFISILRWLQRLLLIYGMYDCIKLTYIWAKFVINASLALICVYQQPAYYTPPWTFLQPDPIITNPCVHQDCWAGLISNT